MAMTVTARTRLERDLSIAPKQKTAQFLRPRSSSTGGDRTKDQFRLEGESNWLRPAIPEALAQSLRSPFSLTETFGVT